MADTNSTEKKCYFESEEFANSLPRRGISRAEASEFKKTMDDLLGTGAERPTEINMSDWYYMKEHGKQCLRCRDRFYELAIKARKSYGPIDGPTTLLDGPSTL